MNGKVMKYMRNALELSQKELAEIVGVSMHTIKRYEGDNQKPQPSTLRRFRRELRYTDYDLIAIKEILANPNASSREHAEIKTKLREQARL